MLNFEYCGWARWGIGSSATFGVDTLGWDLRFTLQAVDEKTAVVGADQLIDAHAPEKPLGQLPGVILHSDPAVAAAPTRRRKSRSPVERIVRPQKEPESLPPQPVAEGNEILDAAGEEFICRWSERRGSQYGKDYTVTIWTSEKVPGGIVRVEGKYPDLPGVPTVWMLKSFDAIQRR